MNEEQPLISWQKLISREGVDITTISHIDLVFYNLFREVYDRGDEIFFTRIREGHLTHYTALDTKAVGLFLYKKYFNTAGKIIAIYEDGLRLIETDKKTCQEWLEKINNNPTKDILLSAFAAFRTTFETVSNFHSIISWVAVEVWQSDFEDMLNRLIAQAGVENEREHIMAVIYRPWKKTALTEIQDLLAAGQSAEDLARKYQFLRSWAAVWFKPITPEWILSIRREAAEEGAGMSMDEVINKLNPSEDEKKWIELAPYMVFYKDWRDDLRRQQVYNWSLLFDKLANYFNIDRFDIGYLSLDELNKAISNDVIDRDLIKERKNGDCVVTLEVDTRKIFVINPPMPLAYKEIIDEVEQENSEHVVRGRIAQPGVVRGLVRVVRSFHDIKHVIQGDILVANTTHPNYLPAMQKAAAFITNEGGTISHAAIVAREMKKPCIVGTKNATKLLKNGDIVEVNADEGVVTIINKDE